VGCDADDGALLLFKAKNPPPAMRTTRAPIIPYKTKLSPPMEELPVDGRTVVFVWDGRTVAFVWDESVLCGVVTAKVEPEFPAGGISVNVSRTTDFHFGAISSSESNASTAKKS
jgi:hypothetical protein